MESNNFDTLREAMDALSEQGYSESFKAEDNSIVALFSKKEYQPNQLKITRTFRFEGMNDPGDSMELFAIETNDNEKGTLVMSYSSEHSHNVELIKQIEEVTN